MRQRLYMELSGRRTVPVVVDVVTLMSVFGGMSALPAVGIMHWIPEVGPLLSNMAMLLAKALR